MAALGSVVVELSANLAKFQSDMGKAAQIAEDRMKQIDKAIGLVKTGLGAIGLGFALGATVDKVKEKIEGAIASAAGLQQLSERTGAAVESLSGLASVAKLSGTDMDSLAGGLQKLSKAIVDAQNGGAKTTAAFNAIGIAVDDLKGKGPDLVFKLIADRLATYQDGVEKTVIAQTLLGKTGANLLPVMTDLAKVGDLQIKVTKDQAEAADELEKNQRRLKGSTDAIFKKIGLELVPVLNAFTKALLESQNANDGVRKSIDGLAKDGSIRDWAEGAAKVVGFVVDAFDGVSRAVQITGKTIGAAVAQAVLLSKGEISAAAQVGKEWYKDIDAILQKQLFSARLAKQLEDAREKTPETAPRGKIDVTKLGNENAGPKDDPTKKLLEGQLRAQEDFIAAEKTQLQSREQTIDFYRNLDYFSLRDAEERKQALLTENLQVVQAAYDKEIAAIQAYIKQADKEVERQDGRNKLAEAQKKRATAEIDTNKQIGDSQNRLLAVQRQFDLATDERARSDSIANAQALFQIDMMGKSTLEVEKLSAARKIQMDLEERIYRLKKLDPEADTSAAIAQGAMQTASATSIIELCYHRQRDAIFGASEAVRKYQEDAANSGRHIENAMSHAFQGMEDALVTFATTGKLSFKSLADSIVADITRIIIKQQIAAALGGNGGGGWLSNLAGMAAGALFGTTGTAAVASSMGGDALDNMMNLTNAFGTAPGRAVGGPVSSGGLYEVNESGQPELLTTGGKQYLMMGAQSGTVTPQATTPARGDTYVTVQVSPPVGSSRETAQQWGAAAGRQLQQALRRNG